MKKTERHLLIQQMIRNEKLSTQNEIQDRLEAQGIAVTQTTLSRDLRDLGLVKVKRKDQLYYILPNEPEVAEIYIMLSSHAKSVSRAEFTLVLRTELGEAALLANGVDEMSDERILGTVAGANTLLIVCRDQEAAIEIQNEILGMMQ